jgi:hypothetical protein
VGAVLESDVVAAASQLGDLDSFGEVGIVAESFDHGEALLAEDWQVSLDGLDHFQPLLEVGHLRGLAHPVALHHLSSAQLLLYPADVVCRQVHRIDALGSALVVEGEGLLLAHQLHARSCIFLPLHKAELTSLCY